MYWLKFTENEHYMGGGSGTEEHYMEILLYKHVPLDNQRQLKNLISPVFSLSYKVPFCADRLIFCSKSDSVA
jgi:hypothetical protein